MNAPRRIGMVGVLGGMGPAATADFMGKLVALTPAQCDQDHIPVMVANLPHVPDRSRNILGDGADPLPYLLDGIDRLNHAGVGLVVVPCNTSHHWFEAMAARSAAPMLHIAAACVDAVAAQPAGRVSIFATRGAIRSGFYQRELAARGIAHTFPDPDGAQHEVDACIRAIKGGDGEAGAAAFARALDDARARRVGAVIMGCTELPVAAGLLERQAALDPQRPSKPMALIDSSLELARAAVAHALRGGWQLPPWRMPVATEPETAALYTAAHV